MQVTIRPGPSSMVYSKKTVFVASLPNSMFIYIETTLIRGAGIKFVKLAFLEITRKIVKQFQLNLSITVDFEAKDIVVRV